MFKAEDIFQCSMTSLILIRRVASGLSLICFCNLCGLLHLVLCGELVLLVANMESYLFVLSLASAF